MELNTPTPESHPNFLPPCLVLCLKTSLPIRLAQMSPKVFLPSWTSQDSGSELKGTPTKGLGFSLASLQTDQSFAWHWANTPPNGWFLLFPFAPAPQMAPQRPADLCSSHRPSVRCACPLGAGVAVEARDSVGAGESLAEAIGVHTSRPCVLEIAP